MWVPPPRHVERVLKDSICLTSAVPERREGGGGGQSTEDLNHVVSIYAERIHKKRFISIFSFLKCSILFCDFKSAPRCSAE